MTQKFYSLENIQKKNATYNVIFGERSNGKTFAALKEGISNFVKKGEQMGYVRRWKEDITGKRASQVFSGINATDTVDELTDGEFQGVHYVSGRWYLCNYDEEGKPIYGDGDVFAYAFALTDVEHNKSTSYPEIKTIIFDEFITNKLYLPDEFVAFMNTVSTIVRRREDVKIYMLGNTVNKYCPYFAEMGLTHIQKMEQGTIDVYTYGESALTVAVEYCESSTPNKIAESHKYFAFNNPKLSMITGGAWELALYPHLPKKYRPNNVVFSFFIDFNDNIFQGDCICLDDEMFIYIHRKTTPIQNPEEDLIYTLAHNPRPNYNRKLHKPMNKAQQRIATLFAYDKVFYQDNDVGDAVANFIKASAKL